MSETTSQVLADFPRITPADVEKEIIYETYFTAEDGVFSQLENPASLTPDEMRVEYTDVADLGLNLVTICALVLRNGHRIVGVNEGPVSAGNFDAALGKKYAREKAVNQIWPLLGYQLRSLQAKV
jgi:hypothetical protein